MESVKEAVAAPKRTSTEEPRRAQVEPKPKEEAPKVSEPESSGRKEPLAKA